MKQDYERDRLVGWTTSEEVRRSSGKSHDQEYMHKLIMVMSGESVFIIKR